MITNRLSEFINKCIKPVIGMVHIQPTPGSPKYSNKNPISTIVADAFKQTEMLINNGIDGIIIENMHDRPYNRPSQLDPIVISIMSIISSKLRNEFPTLAIGIQILSTANKEAMAVAASADLDFIRCEGYVYAHLGDEGWAESCAAALTRYRHSLNCDHIWIMADIKKKHSSHAVTSDISLLETIQAAEFFLADTMVITGPFTAAPPDFDYLVELKNCKSLNTPIILGSGITEQNIEKYFNFADIFIIGSYFKKNGYWANEIDVERVSKFMTKFKYLNN